MSDELYTDEQIETAIEAVKNPSLRATLQITRQEDIKNRLNRVKRSKEIAKAHGDPLGIQTGKPVNNNIPARRMEMQLFVGPKTYGGEALRPASKTVTESLYKGKRLTSRQLRAVTRLYEDATRAYGDSDGLTSSYKERVDKSGHKSVLVKENQYEARLRRLVNFLHPSQRIFLAEIIADYHKHITQRPMSPALIGKMFGNYSNEAQAYANGVGWIGMFLNSLADFYGV